MPHLTYIYEKLLAHYGKQAWWPISYNFNPGELEICIGAILTQNTSWKSVEKALSTLSKNNCTAINDFIEIKVDKLQQLIKSSGFYKQKAERLKILSNFIQTFGDFKRFSKDVKREDLLNLKGIGPETADSILLYTCNKPYFIIDAYTRKMCKKLKIRINGKDYESYRLFFESNLPTDTELYKEFHALIVQWGKDKFKEI